MQKINFQNLPNQTTPVNATNLNQLQTNVDNGKVEATATLNNPDLNDVIYRTAFYFIMGGTNMPEETNGYLLVQKYSDTYVSQEYITTSGVKYIRTLRSGTWGDWTRIMPSTTTNANGTAVKFPDGTMICYNSKEYTNVDITAQAGGVYYKAFGLTFPVAFYAKPTVTPFIEQNSGIIWTGLGNIGDLTKTGCGLRAICMTSLTGKTLNVGYIAVGRWKA